MCSKHDDCSGKDEKCDSGTNVCTVCPVIICDSYGHTVKTSCSNCNCLSSDCDDTVIDNKSSSWTANGSCPTCECDVGYAGDGYHCGLDSDMDGIPDINLDCSGSECKKDNCILNPNPKQEDINFNGKGDVCDDDLNKACSNYPDSDSDGVGDACDNCKNVKNSDQSNMDGDENGGDLCDDDMDGDGIKNNQDNCPKVSNRDQTDTDKDGVGDICDNCPVHSNNDQKEKYFGNVGEKCYMEFLTDSDRDGIIDVYDNCPNVSNADQLNTDKDSFTQILTLICCTNKTKYFRLRGSDAKFLF